MKRTFVVLIVAMTLTSPVCAFERPWEKDKSKEPTLQEKKPAATVETDEEPAYPKEKLIKYTDKKNGFSVTHPERWKPVNKDNNEYMYFVGGEFDEGKACALFVHKLDTALQGSEDSFLDTFLEELSKSDKIISSKKYNQEIGALTVRIMEYFLSSNSEAQSVCAVFAREASTIIIGGGCDYELEKSERLLHNAISSFRFLK